MSAAPDLFPIAELNEREHRIETAERNAYLVRGQELRAIRDGQLFRERWQTFEEYCEERWELAKRRVYQLIGAADFAEKVHHGGLFVPARERHIRPLLERLQDDADRLAVWRSLLDTLDNVRQLKAQDVEDAIARFVASRNKHYITLDEWKLLERNRAFRSADCHRQVEAQRPRQYRHRVGRLVLESNYRMSARLPILLRQGYCLQYLSGRGRF